MGKIYFGFSGSMLDGCNDHQASRSDVTRRQGYGMDMAWIWHGYGRDMAGKFSPCLNPSHTATIDVMGKRCGISVPIPDKAPRVALAPGDSLIAMSVRGLPRLDTRHEYTADEIASATFKFSRYDAID